MRNAWLDNLAGEVKKGRDVFIAHNATVIGKVELGDQVSVWFNAVLRGDNDWIRIGVRTNVQDQAVIHVDEGVPVRIGANCTLGHAAMVHGAEIGDWTLIGMRATVMNGARIGSNCIIGAHTLITEAMEIPDGSLVLGAPARIIGPATEEQLRRMRTGVDHYVGNAARFLGLKR